MGTFNGLSFGGPERGFPTLVLILVVFVGVCTANLTRKKKIVCCKIVNKYLVSVAILIFYIKSIFYAVMHCSVLSACFFIACKHVHM